MTALKCPLHPESELEYQSVRYYTEGEVRFYFLCPECEGSFMVDAEQVPQEVLTFYGITVQEARG